MIYKEKKPDGKNVLVLTTETATDAAMAEIAIINEYLCDEAREKKTRED